MVEVIQLVEQDWHIKVIAFSSDASGESRKARQLLLQLYPNLVVPDCFAHQVRQSFISAVELFSNKQF